MRIALTITLALLIGLAAQAQDGRGSGNPGQGGFGRGPGRGRFSGMNVGFTTLDSNGDGILDTAEIEAAPQSLAKLDKNSDGQITSDEVRMALPPRPGRGSPGGPGREEQRDGEPQANLIEDMVKTLMAFDANGDGKLSRSELPKRFQGIFDRGDENKDGFLTPGEIRKVAAAQAPPPESAGRGERGGPEGGRGQGPRREFNFIRMDPLLAALDTNGDGILSADEIRNSAEVIRKMDKDGDGKLTREEVMPATGAGRPFEPRGDR